MYLVKRCSKPHITILTNSTLCCYRAQHKAQHLPLLQVIPTALTRLRWWRVCLDEAQMCDNPDRPASAMAAHLQAVHRWAVTGTPMSHDLRDMHGLLTFLRAEPLADATAQGLDVYGRPLLTAAPA